MTLCVSLSSAAVFTVMCYNVLCDKYATRQLYGYCPSWALNWEYRKKGIMEEITGCDADVISLQVSERPLGLRMLFIYSTTYVGIPPAVIQFQAPKCSSFPKTDQYLPIRAVKVPLMSLLRSL